MPCMCCQYYSCIVRMALWDFVALTDIDECATQTHNCGSNTDCTDTMGSYFCACKVGYTGPADSCRRKWGFGHCNSCFAGNESSINLFQNLLFLFSFSLWLSKRYTGNLKELSVHSRDGGPDRLTEVLIGFDQVDHDRQSALIKLFTIDLSRLTLFLPTVSWTIFNDR